jgi:hypothetical protein
MNKQFTLRAIMMIALVSTIVGIGVTPLAPLQSVQAARGGGPGAANPPGGFYSGPRASIALSGDNSIYITWWDNKTGNNEVFFAASNDSGKTFGKSINLSSAKGGSADSQVAAQGNHVYVSWWDNKTGNWEVFSRASADSGVTFNDAIMLKSMGNSPFTLKATPSNMASVDTLVAASGSNEYVVWWDNKAGNWEVVFAKSSDGGKTFGNPINISNSPEARSIGARIAVQGNNVYISWVDVDGSTGQKQVLFRASYDNGETFGTPVKLNSTATGG